MEIGATYVKPVWEEFDSEDFDCGKMGCYAAQDACRHTHGG